MTMPALRYRRAPAPSPAILALVDCAPAGAYNLTDVGDKTYFLVYGGAAVFCFDGTALITLPGAPVGITSLVAVGSDLYLTAESDRHPGLTSIYRYRTDRFTFIATTEASQLLLTSFGGRAYFRLKSGLWYINERRLVAVSGSPEDILALTVFRETLYVVHHDSEMYAISTYDGSGFTRLESVPAEGPFGFAALDQGLYIRTHRHVYVWHESTFRVVATARFTALVACDGVLYAKAFGTNKLGVLGHDGFVELADVASAHGEIHVSRGALYFLDRAGALCTYRRAASPVHALLALAGVLEG
ncbi:hypothetical protein [Cryobacterium sp. PH31-O1]|uniref:hypothetical protein n=1 Tax=Cryobacterium sp. PH31-O1 TaxID=3046306 RepID=UPI0024B87D27|nr:hypothetical protein [Cryobacterium sp. PH31-O1]MDJ0338567.1 hypothetical protein [Cryobacterium sp. PH31-O1]